MNPRMQELRRLGQSVWCDNISRTMIDSGELDRLIASGVTGVTSNPTILMKAITGGRAYDRLLDPLRGSSASDLDVYEALVLPDIRDAADRLRPVYDRTDGVDGYVSLEVNPHLAGDTRGTIEQARRLHREVARPNLMIKVPATPEGLPAIETLLGEGINVNVTLIFSLDMYERVMQAYLAGLQRLLAGGGDASRVASVASFFVSRVDSLVDKRLEGMKKAGQPVDDLFGRAAIANAKLAYAAFQRVFQGGAAFAALRARRARVQRPLWASTSTKNPAYRDTIYVDELIGAETVNTLPPATIEAFLDHGTPALSLQRGLAEASVALKRLAALGIDMDEVTDTLRIEGVKLFADSFDELLANIAGQRRVAARV